MAAMVAWCFRRLSARKSSLLWRGPVLALLPKTGGPPARNHDDKGELLLEDEASCASKDAKAGGTSIIGSSSSFSSISSSGATTIFSSSFSSSSVSSWRVGAIGASLGTRALSGRGSTSTRYGPSTTAGATSSGDSSLSAALRALASLRDSRLGDACDHSVLFSTVLGVFFACCCPRPRRRRIFFVIR